MIDALIFFVLLGIWSAVIAYAILFRLMPLANKSNHAVVHHAVAPAGQDHHAHEDGSISAPLNHPQVPRHKPQVPGKRSFSAYEGFKSFSQGPELTVEDIVRGLSRKD